jgi:hypothetical protein
VIPICHATIAGTRIIGRLTAGYVVFTHDEEERMVDMGMGLIRR